MKTWQGRIDAPASPLFESFMSSVAQDQRIAQYDIRCSRAHARALARAGVISDADAARLDEALAEIADEVRDGSFVWRDELEDVHTHVEARLREKVGELAGALHAGRSRNDQIAADLRLYVMDRTREILAAIGELQEALLALAARYRDAVMPGYTHLQQAQPVAVAQPLLAYVAMLGRDWERFRDSLARADRSPLGSGALAGATFDLDRDFLAAESGFSAVVTNSLDAVSDRDFLVEFVSTAALCMTHLSRFAEDLILWSSVEFGFVRLPDAFASGSSMMPQKKNPDAAELIRAKTALVVGDAVAALTLVKGIPLGYDSDLQEGKTPLFHAADSLLASLRILAAMVPELEFDAVRTEAAVSSFALATDLADYLVRQGVPFREAHAVVGRLVSGCLAEGRSLADLSPAELAAASPHLNHVPELTARASIRRKRTAGSTHPDEIEKQLRAAREEIVGRRPLTPDPPPILGEGSSRGHEVSPSPIDGRGGWGVRGYEEGLL
jgi:argininosuccinate lyase